MTRRIMLDGAWSEGVSDGLLSALQLSSKPVVERNVGG